MFCISTSLYHIIYIQLLLTQDNINQNDYDNFPRTKTLHAKYKSNQKYRAYHCMKSVQIRKFFWSVFSCIRTEYGDLQSKSPYSVQIQQNTDQKKLHIWALFDTVYKKDNSLEIGEHKKI